MKKIAFAGLVLGISLAAPAAALEHEVVIDHPVGTIAADYEGAVRVDTRQVGTVAAAGRQSTLRCRWTASLTVERNAKLGEVLNSRRSMTRDDVASGSKPGWCSTHDKSIDRLVEGQRDTFREAMLALVAEHRRVILAEADSARVAGREG